MRIDKLREGLITKKADAALIVTNENVAYYSGLFGGDTELLITHKNKYLFTDFRYSENAERNTDFTVVETKNDERIKTIFDYAKKENVKLIGIDLSGVSYNEYESCLEFAKQSDIVDLSDVITKQRGIKEPDELAAIAYGAQHNDKLFTHICGKIRNGISENDIKAEIVYYMNLHGAESAFSPIVASGTNSSLPHAAPSNKRISSGDFVTMDFGCKFDGYCSDFTRTVAVSHVDKDMQKVYDIVKNAGEKALLAIKPGMTAKQLDAAARDYIENTGYGSSFGHGLGHGVGLSIHEAPSLNALSENVLEESMVVTIEPGIYLKGRYGVRIEDLCVVASGGCINLNKAPRDLIIL